MAKHDFGELERIVTKERTLKEYFDAAMDFKGNSESSIPGERVPGVYRVGVRDFWANLNTEGTNPLGYRNKPVDWYVNEVQKIGGPKAAEATKEKANFGKEHYSSLIDVMDTNQILDFAYQLDDKFAKANDILRSNDINGAAQELVKTGFYTPEGLEVAARDSPRTVIEAYSLFTDFERAKKAKDLSVATNKEGTKLELSRHSVKDYLDKNVKKLDDPIKESLYLAIAEKAYEIQAKDPVIIRGSRLMRESVA